VKEITISETNREMDDLDALLADLQNTISPSSSLVSPGSGSGSAYGSLNSSARGRYPSGPGGDYGTTRSMTTERYESHHSQSPSSPTYLNEKMIQETVTTTNSIFTKSSRKNGLLKQ